MSDDLDFEKESARAIIHDLHGEVLEALTGGATVPERDTWPVKELAAHAVVENRETLEDYNMLATEAALSGTDVQTLAATIVYKSKMFKLLVGKAAGLRAAGLAAIEACPTVAHVEATLANIQAQVEAEIATNS